MTEKPADVTLGILNNTVLLGFGEIRKDLAAHESMLREVVTTQRADHDALIKGQAKQEEHGRWLDRLDKRDRLEAIGLLILMFLVALVPEILKILMK